MARTDKPGSFKLNPHAPAFVPQHRAPHQPNSFQDVQADVADLVVAEGQKHVSHQPPSQLPATASSAAVAARDWLTELPTEVLEAVLGQLTDPADLASAARVCRRLHSTAGQAAVRLRVRVCPLGQRHSPPDAGVQRVRSMLEGICSSFPGVRELDLSACPVSDSDVLGMLRALPQLRILHLSGCKKLSPAMVTHALRTLQNRGSQGLELTSAGLRALAEGCPQLQMLLLGGSTFSAALSSPQEQLQTPPAEPAMWWHRTDVARLLGTAAGLPSRGASGSSRLQPHNGVLVRELVALASKLPALRVVELTFFPPGVAEAVADGLAEEATFAPPLIWDLCRRSSLREALTLLRTGHFPPASAADSARRAGGSFDSPGGFEGPDPMAQLTMALEAAANCSSAARQTPLHVAAEQGSLVLTQALLEVGVQVDARDRSGASALFTACEHGHCSVAALLLQAGAAGALQNSSGEAPLYIAALRGHMAVVDLLLAHFDWHHIPWQDPRLFGDGWTPLMAAAVADRRNIALRLLSAAGPDAAGFVRAANRYGQTAVHIAARRGSCHMLRILLAAGGAACAMEADKSGDTPQRIAGYNNHREAQALLADAAGAL
ncbi:hypothetical protein WJX72_005233 [[Myrmecia] bisecta]|uniref:F-box domain-containing protein n=1 Tax=[Myrmecia] bisecta TaxID=41462 RepID=A0AAW1R6T6_9CHLO